MEVDRREYPIRVLHVVTHLNRNGLESRIMDIYRNIDRSKIQFDFMIHRNDKGDFGDEIEHLGGKIHMMRRISPTEFIKYLLDLNLFFKKYKEYFIVHSHLNSLSTWILLIAKINGVPVRIAHSRNANMEMDIKAIPKRISKIFVNIVATDRLACSIKAGEWLFGSKSKYKFQVIPNAFNIDDFIWNVNIRETKRKELKMNNENVVFINVARLSRQKNHIFLLEVFREIVKINNMAHLFLVGSGECEEEIKNAINKNYLQNNVHMLGSRKDVADLYQAADLFLFPSKYEGFGTVLLEAQITNLPVIASDTIPEETKLCQCVKFMSLDLKAINWAKKAIELIQNSKRCDNSMILRKYGFDIKKQYKIMENYYLDKQLEKGE